MILTDFQPAWTPHNYRAWDGPTTETVFGAEPWFRASRHRIDRLVDDRNRPVPLRNDLWVAVSPPRGDGRWRAEADLIAPAVIGRGPSTDSALRDWRKRFLATFERFLELRPFEMTAADRDLWAKFQFVVDVPQYRAETPLVVRQVGRVVKVRPGRTMVKWEDGTLEKVNPLVFDDAFTRFPVDQRFEATVSRHPFTFRIRRAEAVRKLPAAAITPEDARTLWERITGPGLRAEAGRLPEPGMDETFWLEPTE